MKGPGWVVCWVALMGLLLTLAGCCCGDEEWADESAAYEEEAPEPDDGEETKPDNKSTKKETKPKPDKKGKETAKDAPKEADRGPKGKKSGRVLVKFAKPRNKDFKDLVIVLKEEETFKTIASDLEKRLKLPVDLPIVFEECDTINAFYDPEAKRVSMCYELIDNFYRVFEDAYDDPDDVQDAALGATFHTFLHEIGHALVDILKLPITGREEDAVDQLATYVLLDYGADGEQMAIDGAEAFVLEEDEDEELVFWGEHSLGPQRFYSILCLIYGKDPEKYHDMVNEEYLPEERAEGCPFEYAQLKRSWLALLKPHRRK